MDRYLQITGHCLDVATIQFRYCIEGELVASKIECSRELLCQVTRKYTVVWPIRLVLIYYYKVIIEEIELLLSNSISVLGELTWFLHAPARLIIIVFRSVCRSNTISFLKLYIYLLYDNFFANLVASHDKCKAFWFMVQPHTIGEISFYFCSV